MKVKLQAISLTNVKAAYYYEQRTPGPKSFFKTLFNIKDPDTTSFGTYPPHVEIHYFNGEMLNVVFISDALAIDFYKMLIDKNNLHLL
jgi:hypothetical protein